MRVIEIDIEYVSMKLHTTIGSRKKTPEVQT